MAKKVLFRSSIGGYHKGDVNRYITETDQEMRNLQKALDRANALNDELQAKTAMLEDEQQALQARLDRAIAESTTLQQHKEQLSKAVNEANALITASTERIEKLQSGIVEKDVTFAALNVKYKALAEALQGYASDPASLSSLADKAKRYDTMSREYGDTILEAKSEASSILSDAHSEAEMIKNDAVEAVQEIKETAHRQIEATLEGNDQSFKNLIMNFIEDYTKYANKLHADLDSIIAGAKDRVDDISYAIPAPSDFEVVLEELTDQPISDCSENGEA